MDSLVEEPDSLVCLDLVDLIVNIIHYTNIIDFAKINIGERIFKPLKNKNVTKSHFFLKDYDR